MRMGACKLAELPDELLIDIFTKVCKAEIFDNLRRGLDCPDFALLYLSRRFLHPAVVVLYAEPKVRGEKGVTAFARTLSRDPNRAAFATRLSIMCALPSERIYNKAKPAHPFCLRIESVLQRASNLQQLLLKDVTITDHVIRGFRCLPSLRVLALAGRSEFASASMPGLCQNLLQCLADLSLEKFLWISQEDEDESHQLLAQMEADMFCSAEHRDTAQNFSSAVVEPAYCKEMRLDFQVRSSRPAYIRESHRCLLYEIAEGPLKPFSHLWLDITGLAKPQLLIDDAEDISCIVGKLEVFTFEFREEIGSVTDIPEVVKFFNGIMSASENLQELRIRATEVCPFFELLLQIHCQNLRYIHIDLLGEITGLTEQESPIQYLQDHARLLPPSLKLLSFNWVEPECSIWPPSASAAEGLLNWLDELHVNLAAMGIQFRDNRFKPTNGHTWSLVDYAYAMPLVGQNIDLRTELHL